MTSQRQIDANRRNAQKSNGPKTPEGRAAVRFNALRHGLTAQNAVLSDEDERQFNQTLKAFQDEFQPVGPTENFLVHQIVMAAWRLQRIRGIETGFFDLRMLDHRPSMEEEYNNLNHHHRHAYVFFYDVRGANTLPVLSRYEARAERSFYRALHELQRLQARRAGQNIPPPAAVDLDLTVPEQLTTGPAVSDPAARECSILGMGLFGKMPGTLRSPPDPLAFPTPAVQLHSKVHGVQAEVKG